MCHMIEYKLHRITSQQSGFVPAFTTTKGKQGMEQVELTIASSCKSSKNRDIALFMKFCELWSHFTEDQTNFIPYGSGVL